MSRKGHFYDPVGELLRKAERSDGQCVGARFIAPAGRGGANVAQFANRIFYSLDVRYHEYYNNVGQLIFCSINAGTRTVAETLAGARGGIVGRITM